MAISTRSNTAEPSLPGIPDNLPPVAIPQRGKVKLYGVNNRVLADSRIESSHDGLIIIAIDGETEEDGHTHHFIIHEAGTRWNCKVGYVMIPCPQGDRFSGLPFDQSGIIVTNYRYGRDETGEHYITLDYRRAPRVWKGYLTACSANPGHPMSLRKLIITGEHRAGRLQVRQSGNLLAVYDTKTDLDIGYLPAKISRSLIRWLKGDPHYALHVKTGWHVENADLDSATIEVSICPYWRPSPTAAAVPQPAPAATNGATTPTQEDAHPVPAETNGTPAQEDTQPVDATKAPRHVWDIERCALYLNTSVHMTTQYLRKNPGCFLPGSTSEVYSDYLALVAGGDPQDQQDMLRPDEVAERLQMGASKVHDDCKKGRIRSVNLTSVIHGKEMGKNTRRIPAHALRDLLQAAALDENPS